MLALRNDGAPGYIWEPVYRLRVELSPCERELIQSPPFRRLRRIAHYGAAAQILPMGHSRFDHVLGVFALVAHLAPDDVLLRLAALCHDLGHLPFSHSAERALGLDHRALGLQVLHGPPVGDILADHGFDPVQVAGYISGTVPNLLLGRENLLGIDHLDSFLRDTHMAGLECLPAHLLVRRLGAAGPVLTADLATGLDIARRVVADHALFLAPAALALDCLVAELFRRALTALDPSDLLGWGDAEALAALAAQGPAEAQLVMVLLERPWAVHTAALEPGEEPGPGELLAQANRVYRKEILTPDGPLSAVSAAAVAIYRELEHLPGRWRVSW